EREGRDDRPVGGGRVLVDQALRFGQELLAVLALEPLLRPFGGPAGERPADLSGFLRAEPDWLDLALLLAPLGGLVDRRFGALAAETAELGQAHVEELRQAEVVVDQVEQRPARDEARVRPGLAQVLRRAAAGLLGLRVGLALCLGVGRRRGLLLVLALDGR